jgi:hypothetical protein
MTRSTLATTAAITLMLISCGGGDGGAPAEGTPLSQAAGEEDAAPNRLINAFEFSPTGVAPVSELPSAAELTLTGGCSSPGRLSIGFSRGAAQDDTYFQFAMESSSPVASGQTGEVALTSINWDNGVEVAANLPADSPVRVPSRLQGTGTLTIESHTGTGMAGRMSGTVSGTVTDTDTGDPVTIDVTFDINLACAN